MFGLNMAEEEEEYGEEDIMNILVSTDNHIGYLERDPIRGEDSFLAFEEVLATARAREVDMLLLAGDLFHENKPSRYTLWRTMELLRRYVMGPNPINIQVVSDYDVSRVLQPFKAADSRPVPARAPPPQDWTRLLRPWGGVPPLPQGENGAGWTRAPVQPLPRQPLRRQRRMPPLCWEGGRRRGQ